MLNSKKYWKDKPGEYVVDHYRLNFEAKNHVFFLKILEFFSRALDYVQSIQNTGVLKIWSHIVFKKAVLVWNLFKKYALHANIPVYGSFTAKNAERVCWDLGWNILPSFFENVKKARRRKRIKNLE